MDVKLRKQSEIVARYIDAAEPQYSAVLIEADWLDRAGVRVIKMTTSVATMRSTVHFISTGRQPVDDIKRHCEQWLKERYKLVDFVFYQSLDEKRSSTPLSTYFHCIARVPDAVAK